MKNVFVSTGHVNRFARAAAVLEQRFTDKEVMGIGFIQGSPGKGKTRWMRHYDAMSRKQGQVRTVAVMAKGIWTPTSMLKDLNAAVGGATQSYRKDALFDELERCLRDHPAMILIDEADVVAESKDMVRILKNIHDLTQSAILLFGELGLKSLLKRFHSFFNRINTDAIITAGDNTEEDVAALIKARCEVPVERDVCKAVFEDGGNFSLRTVVDQVRAMERLAENNNIQTVTLREYRALRTGSNGRAALHTIRSTAAADVSAAAVAAEA